MKVLFLILLSFLPAIIFGQINFDTTAIRSDSIFRSFSLEGVPPLTTSKNFIEIRFITIPAPVGRPEYKILSFDGEKWNSYLVTSHGYDTTIKMIRTTQTTLLPKIPYTDILEKLNKLGLFQLKSDQELRDCGIMTIDGAYYNIIYKIGGKLRNIRFKNPDAYERYCPKIREYAIYSKIVKIFTKYLVKE